MAQTIRGTVTSKSRKGTGIQIDKGQWINGTEAQLASINWKDEVEAEVEGKNIVSIKLTSARDGGGSAPAGNAGYQDRQNAIEWQSARRDAITLANNLVANGVAPMPTAKAEKYDHYLSLVDTLTLRLYNVVVPEREPVED